MNRICKPGPIVTSVAAIIITSPHNWSRTIPPPFVLPRSRLSGRQTHCRPRCPDTWYPVPRHTMAIESPDNETSWRGSMMSRLPWEVDHRESDSHTSICDRLPPTTIRLDPETSTEEEQKNQSAKNVITNRVSSLKLHVECKHFSYHTYFQLMGWD